MPQRTPKCMPVMPSVRVELDLRTCGCTDINLTDGGACPWRRSFTRGYRAQSRPSTTSSLTLRPRGSPSTKGPPTTGHPVSTVALLSAPRVAAARRQQRSAARRCRSDLRAEIWPAGKAAGRSIPGARPAATRYCAGQCRRPPGSPTDSTRARAVAELAVQRRRECRREEWNTQTRVAALLKRHLPIGCFSTALGNSPRSPLAGFLAKQRGTRGGLPDWWFIWRGGEYFRRIKIARRDCAAWQR